MPLYRRIPGRGFNNARFATNHAIVNVSTLEERFETGAEITELALRESGILRGRCDGVKILGQGNLTKSFKVSVAAVSTSAREKIEKAGGSVTVPAAS